MIGPGKYDGALSAAREATGATGALLIVLDGKSGPGFSCQGTAVQLARVPAVLRIMADQIEADLRNGQA